MRQREEIQHCHLATVMNDPRDQQHALDQKLVLDILEFLTDAFPEDTIDALETLKTYPAMSPQLALPWLSYVTRIEGTRGVERYLAAHGKRLPPTHRKWLELQQRAHLSIWETLAVNPGVGLTLRDAFTGIVREVHEVTGSKTAQPHVFLLARVVDASPHPLMCGVHDRPLMPGDGGRVVARMRKVLRRKGNVPPERLLDPKIAWRMLLEWTNEIEQIANRVLTNTDGDPLLLTIEQWSFDPERRAEVVAAFETLEGSTRDDEAHDSHFRVLRRDRPDDFECTVVAAAIIGGSSLRVETNSIARADAIRRRVQAVCRSLLGRALRRHSDPLSTAHDPLQKVVEARNEEHERVVLEYKTAYYKRWLDEPVPALGNLTPREAAKSREGREPLRLLLNNLEIGENRFPEASRLDVKALRKELRL